MNQHKKDYGEGADVLAEHVCKVFLHRGGEQLVNIQLKSRLARKAVLRHSG